MDEGNLRNSLAAFLSDPVETLDVEYGDWMVEPIDNSAKANIAKEIIALANHGGGYLIFGFAEDSHKQLVPSASVPASLHPYSVDAINQIVRGHMEPPFHCDVRIVESPITGTKHPIVIVPGNHRVPVRARKGCPPLQDFAYYCRTPGPNSDRPQSGRDWDEIIGRCVSVRLEDERDKFAAQFQPIVERMLRGVVGDSVSTIREDDLFSKFIASAWDRFRQKTAELKEAENDDRYQHGVWSFAYHISNHKGSLTQNEMLASLASVPVYTGWRPWNVTFSSESMRPYPINGLIECWCKDAYTKSPAQSDFWQVDPKQLMLIMVDGYDDDATEKVPAGTTLDPLLVVWRVGERVMHAINMALSLATEDSAIRIEVEWHGLNGRRLRCWSSPRYGGFNNNTSHQDSVSSSLTITPIAETTIPDTYVHSILEPLFTAFGFSELPMDFTRHELEKMVFRTT